MVGAIAHGAFWAMIGTIGAQLVPPRYVGVATSIIFGGFSVASVIVVPLSNAVAREYSWNMAFIAISVLSLISMIAISVFLPKLTQLHPLQCSALQYVLKDKTIMKIYGAKDCDIPALFYAFTYI